MVKKLLILATLLLGAVPAFAQIPDSEKIIVSPDGLRQVEVTTASEMKVNCTAGCSGGTAATDNDAVAPGQTSGLAINLSYIFTGVNWVRWNGHVSCDAGCAGTTAVTAGPTTFTATGTLTLALAGNPGAAIQAAYTAATLAAQIFVSYDNGLTYQPAAFTDQRYGVVGGRTGSIVETAETSTHVYLLGNIPGATHVRYSVANYTSGSAVVNIRATQGVSNPPYAIGNDGDTETAVSGGMQLGGYPAAPAAGIPFTAVQVTTTAPLSTAAGLVIRNASDSAPGSGISPALIAVGGYDKDEAVMRLLEMREADPSASDRGVVVRNIPSGTQGVSWTSAHPVFLQDLAGNYYSTAKQLLSTGADGTDLLATGMSARYYDAFPCCVNSGDFGTVRMSAAGVLYGQIRDAAGNERGANVNANNQLSISADTWLGSTAPTVGQKAMVSSVPVVIASNQSAVPISGTVTITDGAGAVNVIVDSGTLALSAGSAVIGHVITDTGSTTAVTGNVTVVQPAAASLNATVVGTGTFAAQVTGTVTANAGTNLNTALLALEAGGNLAAIKADVDKIPSQGQALAAASMPVVLPAAQITTLTPPAAITNYALETGGNLATVAAAVHTEDGPAADGDKGMLALGQRRDLAGSYTSTDGDYETLQLFAGWLRTMMATTDPRGNVTPMASDGLGNVTVLATLAAPSALRLPCNKLRKTNCQ